ncbi:hypothetical protein INT47_005046 [Mucor saturninus]|uniref:Reverse transcriptase n=1 Tax=Mucor saturninus TaxID=64648 RepID=A0A8H7QPE2_9FUNG|nr:hypothetical protein INT47_005046 [Mucor saturninus]
MTTEFTANSFTPGTGGSNQHEYAELIKHFTTLLADSKNAKIKEPTTYDGTRDALVIDSWVRSVERYVAFFNWTQEKSYLFASTLMRDRADAWFRTIELEEDAPTTWLELKRLIIEFFRPDNANRMARDRLACLQQTGDLVTYINEFMDIKLALPKITDDEACDKFIRGLSNPRMRAHIRQYEADTIKDAIHAALSYDSAQQEHGNYVNTPTNPVPSRRQPVDDPMDLDAIDSRFNSRNNNRSYNRSNYGSYRQNNSYSRHGNSGYRNGNNNSSRSSVNCYYCQKPGHIKLNVVDGQEVQLHCKSDNYNTENIPDNNKNLIDFDSYTTASSSFDKQFPTLIPHSIYYSNTPSHPNTVANTSSCKNIVVETIPIVYSNVFTDDFHHIEELNAIATSLPLYPATHNGQQLATLIDSGASDNYVSPHVVKMLPKYRFTLVHDRQVETAGGTISKIKYKVAMLINLNGYLNEITAYVFATKFDLILGRSWLKQVRPTPDWLTDSWYLNNGRVRLEPLPQSSKLRETPKLNYLISHKQADRFIKKGGDGFLLFIQPVDTHMELHTATTTTAHNQDDTYWDQLVKEFTSVFRDELPGLPPDRGIHHLIDTGNANPVSRPPYKMSPLELDELQKQLKELLQLGLIKPSASPWGASVLFVRKKPDPGSDKPGALRMCIDYRAVNKLTTRNSSSLPRIDECLERLGGARYFTSLDLKSGYHQIRIAPSDVPKTAFNTRYGQFSWLVLPFGLSNAPPVFQSLMSSILAEHIDKTVLVYLDDILIYSKNYEDHKKHVRQILNILKKEKLIANLKKCEFGKSELTFVGYRISRHGISPSPDKVKILQNWPRMTNVQEVRQFIGFAQFYKRFIKNFASIAAPLTDLTRGTGMKTRPIVWTDACQKSFDRLKELLASSTVLHVVDMTKPFHIEVDASDRGCGAVLLQPGDDPSRPWHPICFESKKYADSEAKLPAQERELMSILHALRVWRCYVDGCPAGYTVFSDHLPLEYFRSKDKPPSRLVRWINELELYSPKIVYKPGKENTIPDILSRMPFNDTPSPAPMEPDYLYAVWDKFPTTIRYDWPLLLIPSSREKVKTDELKALLDKEAEKFHITANRVFRKVVIDPTNNVTKLVAFLPFAERADTVSDYHDTFGHAGFKSMIKFLTPRFWWPTMKSDVQQWISVCPSCQINSRKPRAHQDEMHPLKVPTAFDRWHLDFLDLPTTTKGNRWLLVGVDYATNWCVARAMPVASKEAVADFIYEEIVMNFGAMSEIVTDRGANFTSALVQEYVKRVGAKFKLTSAYHPRSNAKAERFNGVIKQMLRKYTNGALHRWDDFVQAALWACRIRVHSTTGFSPFYLTYGREPRLPGDVLQPYIDKTTFADPRTVADFTSRELTDLGQHRAAAEFRLKAMGEKDKQRWDSAIKKLSFEPGDMVLLTHEGRYGLEPRFKGPFIVVESFPDYGTYKLQTLAGEPLKSLVHVDRLRPAHGERPTEPWYNPTETRREFNDFMKDKPLDPNSAISNLKDSTDFIDPIQENDTQIDTSSNIEPSSSPQLVKSTDFVTLPKQIIVPPVSIPTSSHSSPSHMDDPIDFFPAADVIPMSSDLLTDTSLLPGSLAHSPLTASSDPIDIDSDPLSDHHDPIDLDSDPLSDHDPIALDSDPLSDLDPIVVDTDSVLESVQGRTQSLKGGNVKPVNIDGSDISKNRVTVRNSPVSDPDLDMDMPLEIELRLKKTKNQKRRFVPVKNNHMNRKRPKPNNTT